MPKVDLLIRNGEVVDGSGRIRFRADVGVSQGRITHMKPSCTDDAETVLNAEGLIVCPGFIDTHSHSDTSVQFDNRLESMIRQGVTTSVIGNCGSSLAPINEDTLELMQQELDVFSPPGHKLNITWRSYGEYLENLEKIQIPLNMVPLVGFAAIRIAAGPAFENRAPTQKELANMKAAVAESMEAGALGMSTGLFYPPQSYASTSEVAELAKTVAKYNGLYFSHIRNEGAEVVQAVEEVIRIVEESGCRGGQIAHHKIAGQSYWGTSRDTLKLIAEANGRGLQIRCDQYPYNRGMTSVVSLLPPWVHEGGMESILHHLDDPESQRRIRGDIEARVDGWENIVKEVGWQNIYIASVKTEKWKDAQGKSLLKIAQERGYSDQFLLLFEILLDEAGETTMTIESMGEDDIRRIMSSKYTMIGTDGWGISPTGVYNYTKPHPRSYGTYPRILGKYVREEGVLSMEEAIWKMTGFPAETLRLKDRGLVREGYCADIVVFDANTIQDKATFIDPHRFPEGIHQVIVNGEIVVNDSEQLDIFPGRVLRRAQAPSS